MRGVTFDNKHTYWDWGLMLKKPPEISTPEPKTHYVDIPGAHGAMDLTEALTGKVQYKNRTLTLEFITKADRENWSALYSDILTTMHGQMVEEITLDDDPAHHYRGRVTVGDSVRENDEWVSIKLTAEVEPFKKSIEGTAML